MNVFALDLSTDSFSLAIKYFRTVFKKQMYCYKISIILCLTVKVVKKRFIVNDWTKLLLHLWIGVILFLHTYYLYEGFYYDAVFN